MWIFPTSCCSLLEVGALEEKKNINLGFFIFMSKIGVIPRDCLVDEMTKYYVRVPIKS